MRFPLKSISILVIFMSACAPATTQQKQEALTIEQNSRKADSITASTEGLTAYLRDTTAKGFTREHGTQFSYFEADGRYNLVYPGNSRVLKGRWQVRKGGLFGPTICYSYTVPTYNPVTRHRDRAGDWSCNNAKDSLMRWQEVRDGDVLSMASTFVLQKRVPKGVNLSLPTAAKAVGLSTHMSPNKSPNPDIGAEAKVGQ